MSELDELDYLDFGSESDLLPEDITKMQFKELALSVAVLSEDIFYSIDRLKYYQEEVTLEMLTDFYEQIKRIEKLLPQ